MLDRLVNRYAYQKAVRAAADNEVVCGTVTEKGQPVYFTMPADADDHQVRSRAFELRHGRPMSSVEETMLDIAETVRGIPTHA